MCRRTSAFISSTGIAAPYRSFDPPRWPRHQTTADLRRCNPSRRWRAECGCHGGAWHEFRTLRVWTRDASGTVADAGGEGSGAMGDQLRVGPAYELPPNGTLYVR